jgi:excisionase family DNA binding protein
MTMVPERPAPPSQREAAMAAEASRALSPFGHVLELRLQLGDGGVLLLPRPAVDLLRRALAEIAQGHAVAVTAIDAELTTQEAANHLKVSRPHLIRLLEEGQIRFRRVGTHRRVRFGDLEAYRAKAEEERRQRAGRGRRTGAEAGDGLLAPSRTGGRVLIRGVFASGPEAE